MLPKLITVADDGIGISTQDQGRIFQRFARGTDRLVAEKPGTGLGLYLSRGLAEHTDGPGSLQAFAHSLAQRSMVVNQQQFDDSHTAYSAP